MMPPALPLAQTTDELEHLAGFEDIAANTLRKLDGQAECRAAARADRIDSCDGKGAAPEAVEQTPQLGIIRVLLRHPEIDFAGVVWAEALFPVHIYPPVCPAKCRDASMDRCRLFRYAPVFSKTMAFAVFVLLYASYTIVTVSLWNIE
jgi:hypothetical protein